MIRNSEKIGAEVIKRIEIIWKLEKPLAVLDLSKWTIKPQKQQQVIAWAKIITLHGNEKPQ